MGFELVPLIAFGILGLGNLLHFIGMGTPEWVTRDQLHNSRIIELTEGLWSFCVDGSCETYDDDSKKDWLKACEALAVLGMLVGCAAALVAGFIFVRNLLNKDLPKNLGLICLLTAIASFILILICVIVYGVKIKDAISSYDFGYSFGLSITGAILIAIGGGVAFIGNR